MPTSNVPPTVSPLSRDAQALWDEMMWCCTQRQLADVGARMRSVRDRLPPSDLERLRQMYRIRREQVGAA